MWAPCSAPGLYPARGGKCLGSDSLHFDALEKEMATHSSILDWRTPWGEEPDGLYGLWGRKEVDMTEAT